MIGKASRGASLAKPTTADYRKSAALLKLASNPARLLVLLVLADGEQKTGAIHDLVGRQSLVTFAQHLMLLRLGGLVTGRRQGMNLFYALTDRGRRLVEAVRALLV
jgi:DNA-binding transcriptional ArsR family regulator